MNMWWSVRKDNGIVYSGLIVTERSMVISSHVGVITELLIVLLRYKYSYHNVLLKGQCTHCLFSNSLPPDTNHIKVHGYSNINLIHTNIQPPPEGVLYRSRYILVFYCILRYHVITWTIGVLTSSIQKN